MREDGVTPEAIQAHHTADVCFIGQSYHLEVPIDLNATSPLKALRREFHALHDRIYGYSAGTPARIVNLRTVLRAGGNSKPAYVTRASSNGVTKTNRTVKFSGMPIEAAIFSRDNLPTEGDIIGPAIVEQADTTTLIPPGWSAASGAFETLVLTPCQRS